MTIDATDPIDTSGDSLDVTQTCWTREGEDWDFITNVTPTRSDTAYSGGSAVMFDAGGEQYVEYDFTAGHTIPDGQFGMQYRVETIPDNDSGHRLTFSIDIGQTGGFTQFATEAYLTGFSLGWNNVIGVNDSQPGEIPAGDHTIRIERTEARNADVAVDVIAPYDARFESSFNFDNSVHQNDGYLDGPEFFPDVVPVQLTTTETRRDVTEATAEIDTNTTDANQYIELRIGSDAFDRTNNAASASTTGGPARSIDVTLGLTRYPDDSNPQSATPRYGYNGQSVNSYSLTANPDSISGSGVGEAEVDAIVGQGEITGDRLEESGELTIGGDLLTHSIFSPFDVFSSMSVRSGEKISFSNDE